MSRKFSILKNSQNKSIKLNINKITLNFTDKEIEEDFRLEYFNKSIKAFRVSFVTVILLYSAFGYLDTLTSKNILQEFFFIRYLIVFPLLFSVFLFSFHKYFKKVWQLLLSICFVFSGLGIIYMLLRNPANIYYYGGMFLIFMAGYFFIKLRFFSAIIPAVLLIIAYNLGVVLFKNHTIVNYEHLIITNSFYISANIISMIALYNLEHLERKDFFQRVLLQQAKTEVALINESLEEQVKSRTHLLNLRNKKLSEEVRHRKEIESKLILARDKAQESDKLKSTFLATMSHELRTPLNSIIGFSELINESMKKDQILEFNQIINTSGNHLLKIVDDLFDITLIESGEIKVLNDSFKIAPLLSEVTDVINIEHRELKKDNVSLSLNIPAGLKDLEIYSDSAKLKQILINLLKNALKFTHKGQITYGFRINESTENPTIEFYVKDTGIGISVEKQEIIFDAFRQVEDSDTRTYQGTGIGLSISKKLVELMNGQIWVMSTVGQGSTFYFSLPLNKKSTKIVSLPNTKVLNSLKDKTFLIVEDDDLSYQFLETLIRKKEGKVLWAQDGEEALNICKNNDEVDLVLMDIHIPKLNGRDATKKIKSIKPNLPIIAQTAHAIEGDREKIINAGCDDYITKPINKHHLFELIDKHLQPTQIKKAII